MIIYQIKQRFKSLFKTMEKQNYNSHSNYDNNN